MATEFSSLIEQHAERIKDAARRELESIVAEARQNCEPVKQPEDSRDGRRTMHDKTFEKRESLLTVMVSVCSLVEQCAAADAYPHLPAVCLPRFQLQAKDESFLSIYHAMLATLSECSRERLRGGVT